MICILHYTLCTYMYKTGRCKIWRDVYSVHCTLYALHFTVILHCTYGTVKVLKMRMRLLCSALVCDLRGLNIGQTGCWKLDVKSPTRCSIKRTIYHYTNYILFHRRLHHLHRSSSSSSCSVKQAINQPT